MSTVYADHNGLEIIADDNRLGHSYNVMDPSKGARIAVIDFQNGAVPANGINGVTNESLLAITIHRTEVLNEQFPCVENEQAISAMKGALAAFEARTADRQKRDVEGSLQV
jgi:predicted transcriptional regulator